MNPFAHADESCEALRRAVASRWPFVFTKWGDGAIEVMHGLARYDANCDGVARWADREAEREAHVRNWEVLRAASRRRLIFLGDWQTASDFGPGDCQRHAAEYAGMLARSGFVRLHYECLLLHRLTPSLLDFYRTLRDLPARKVLVTSAHLAGAAEMIGAELLRVPGPREYERSDGIARQTADALLADPPELIVFAAGDIGEQVQAALVEADCPVPQLSVGSGFDPLFLGRTRSGQVAPAAAREYFQELL